MRLPPSAAVRTAACARRLCAAAPPAVKARRSSDRRDADERPSAQPPAARAAFADKPALLLWGLKDIAFRRKELERWNAALPDHELHEFEDCGHFLAEEAPDRVVTALRAFMKRR